MDLSVREAARALHVSDRRVRQLIESGRLRARQVGGMWLVDGASLPTTRRRGRPLAPATARALLAQRGDDLSGRSVVEVNLGSCLDPSSRVSRIASYATRLREDESPETLLLTWAAKRGERVVLSTREPGPVLDDERVRPSGLSDPRSRIGVGGVSEGYVRAEDLADVRRDHLLRPPSGEPNVILHVVPDLPPDPLPPLYVAADLAEHDGPRELTRARELIREVVGR